MSLKRMFLIAILFVASVSEAAELYDLHRNVRALGMGNAFISVVEGEEALFFNPAAISRNSGVFWTLIDPAAGLNTLDTDILTTFSDLTNQATFETAFNNLMGEPFWTGLNAKTAVAIPFFTLAYYYDTDTSIFIDNPVAPEMQANMIIDQGLALGAGFGMGPIEIGGTFKRIDRTGGRGTFGPSVISDIVSGTSTPDVIFDTLSANGVGYAFDFGLNVTAPVFVQPTFSFVWRNVGNTSFRAAPGELKPPTDEQEFIVGGSMTFDAFLIHITPSIDVRHLDNSDAQIGKKIHLGVELGLPLLDLRAGYHQGYLSYGAGIDLGFMQIDAASWGVELGEYPGQFEDRRYMVQATIRLGLNLGLGHDPSSSSDSTSSSSSRSGFGSSGSSRSRGGSRRSKVRR